MYKFPQSLIKNILLNLMFIIAFGGASFYLLVSYTAQQTFAQQKVIKMTSLLYKSHDISVNALANELLTTLTANDNYQKLIIKRNSQIIANYKDKEVNLLNSFLAKTKVLSVDIGKLNLQVEYQLNFINLINFLFLLYTCAAMLSLIFAFIATILNSKLQTTIVSGINNQINYALEKIETAEYIKNTDDKEKTLPPTLFNLPALNDGILKIKSTMQEQLNNTISLEVKAHVDSLTGINNRNRFIHFYEKEIINETSDNFGVLLVTRCTELQRINQEHGYNAGDQYILKVAEIIKAIFSTVPDGKVFRLNSSDFATIIPNIKLKAAEKYAADLTLQFNEYQQISELNSVAFTSLVYFEKSKPIGDLLALADTGISIAQTQIVNSWYSQKNIQNNTNSHLGNQNWRDKIEDVLRESRITLLLQPIQPSGRNTRVYSEVLARFMDADEKELPTATFFAMAEKQDKISDIDKLIIDTTIKEITNKNMLNSSYGINISSRSIKNEHFIIWLERKLLREPNAASKLVFEISELGLQQNFKKAKHLVEMLHRAGSRITVERFGIGLTSFKFFRDLTPDYIKMDSSYTENINNDKNNQYFLRLMVDLAHRLGISVLAENVESQEEKQMLEKLFIDGCQGYYIGKPTKL